MVINMFPCNVKDTLTSPLELVFSRKPDYITLVPLFATTYFKYISDGNRIRDGSESKVMQAILLGRSEKADGYLLYSPSTRELYVSSDYKIDTGNCTATAFIIALKMAARLLDFMMEHP